VALAPAIFFEHSKEESLRLLANEKMLQRFVVNADYLEFTGTDFDKEEDGFLCYVYPKLCDEKF
jgi:hypothetical protein